MQNLIKELIEKIGISVESISLNEENGNTTWFSVLVKEPYFFLDRGGEGLSSLNHVFRRILEAKNPELSQKNENNVGVQNTNKQSGLGILIDINNYQKKRVENLRAVAHMMAERARYFKSNIEVDPMSPFDRRIVHEFLANETDLKTESQGVGPSRRVVIKYIGNI